MKCIREKNAAGIEWITVNQKTVRRLPDCPAGSLSGGLPERQQVFIVGSKGIPAFYGGFETFVEKLTEYRVSDRICYHIARMGKNNLRYEYNGAECFNINTPMIGPARAIWYDIAALRRCIRWCRRDPGIARPVFYVLACRIGPFIGYFRKKIERLDGVLYVNPDGHEWKRGKWSRPVQYYWKLSERLMVKHADLVICDSACIRKYIHKKYEKYRPRTKFISYGCDNTGSSLSDGESGYVEWMKRKCMSPGEYYLVVSRFVPENNFETILREFMRSDSRRDLVIIATQNSKFYCELENKLHFSGDKRIKFAGTVYNEDLLKRIRENAYAYFHGHEVGGTNPSLLEALGSTRLNLLLDVEFNREVAGEAALYWTKGNGDLAALIGTADRMEADSIERMGALAKERIDRAYRWMDIVDTYEALFLNRESVSI